MDITIFYKINPLFEKQQLLIYIYNLNDFFRIDKSPDIFISNKLIKRLEKSTIPYFSYNMSIKLL